MPKATLHVGASYTNAYDLTCGYQNSNLYSTNIVKELSPPPPPGPYSLDVQKFRRTVFPRELGPGGGGGGGEGDCPVRKLSELIGICCNPCPVASSNVTGRCKHMHAYCSVFGQSLIAMLNIKDN